MYIFIYFLFFIVALWSDQIDSPALKTCKVEDDLRWSSKRPYKHLTLTLFIYFGLIYSLAISVSEKKLLLFSGALLCYW